jgi:hypothetical protein
MNQGCLLPHFYPYFLIHIQNVKSYRDDMTEQTPLATNPQPPVRARYSEDWDTADQVLKDGIDVVGRIRKVDETPDPQDDEHHIFRIEYEYMVNHTPVVKDLEFSINIMHIVYGFAGGLTNTPKFKYGLDDFRNAVQAGQPIYIKVVPKEPYWWLVEFNDVMSEIMNQKAVWM